MGYQNVIVMRHGDRIDQAEPLWTATAERPWDPPLIDAGKVRAFCAGKKFRSQLGFQIHRVIVSPFLRCVQTAAAATSALCAAGEIDAEQTSPDGLTFDPSKIKVSIEYGLCEMLNRKAIRADVAPKDGIFSFSFEELEALFPAGTVDHSVEPVYHELPKWEESVLDTRTRYSQIVKSLADKYPAENLLLVTHAEGVGVALTTFMKSITVYEVEYCTNVHLKREITFREENSFTSKDFEVVPPLTGITFFPLTTTSSD